MPDVLLPRLSDSMEEGTILLWLKADGDDVAAGEALVEIETDKAAMTYEAEDSGVLTVLAAEGETLAVGAPIARIARVPAAVSERRAPASPVARRMARHAGVDLEGVQGSGPRGRIVKADVEAIVRRLRDAPPPPVPEGPAAPSPAAAPPPATVPAPAPAPAPAAPPTTPAVGAVEVTEPSRLQRAVARRMVESKASAPDFHLTAEVDMAAARRLREDLKAAGAAVPSYNDLVVKACALALREHPRANGAFRDGRFESYARVNVGIAVAAPDALLVPTVFDADRLSLGEIARRTRDLAARARDGALAPAELEGGTFCVSNLGMFGIRRFAAVLNPPQAGILAVGALADRPAVRDGELVVGFGMDITLTADHRILYGADAAALLGAIRDRLERPLALAVD